MVYRRKRFLTTFSSRDECTCACVPQEDGTGLNLTLTVRAFDGCAVPSGREKVSTRQKIVISITCGESFGSTETFPDGLRAILDCDRRARRNELTAISETMHQDQLSLSKQDIYAHSRKMQINSTTRSRFVFTFDFYLILSLCFRVHDDSLICHLSISLMFGVHINLRRS